jgi:hypothetical protein
MYALSSSWENVMLKRYRPIVCVDNMTWLMMQMCHPFDKLACIGDCG